jgi:hypothetical protein
MELNMPNPDAKDFCEAYGITLERQRELSRCLDELIDGYGKAPVFVYLHHTIRDIAKFCQGPEEHAYCLILHCAWHQRRGDLLAPGGKSQSYYKVNRTMFLWLRKVDGNFSISAFDSTRRCHLNKKVDELEWREAFAFYSNSDYPMMAVDDQGQSEELYEIKLP